MAGAVYSLSMEQSPSRGGRAERLRARRRVQRRRAVVVIGVAIAAALIVGALVLARGSDDGATRAASTKRRVTTTPTNSPTTTALTIALTTEPPTTAPTSGSATTIPPAAAVSRAVLRSGSRGSDVVALQERLTALGYNPGTADGIFSSATTAAVVAFQRAKGLAADGVVGAQTWAALNAGQ
jgi:murein L,D-transpeptidase YcbB/YkuD